ncbi:MAG: hypothetical protein QOF97_3016 [Acidimicrobiaceae bacterium]
MITGWVVLPLVLFAAVAAFMAASVRRERAAGAEAGARERALLVRLDDLETALAAALAALPEPTPPPVDPIDEPKEELPTNLTDPLTGLFNESFFRVTLDTRVSAARRHLRPVAVVLVQVAQGVREGV